MAEAWTVEALERLEVLVQALLRRPSTLADIPALRDALAWQARVLERAYRVAGQQQEQLQALRPQCRLRGVF